IKFAFLHDLTERGVFWVGTAKENMLYDGHAKAVNLAAIRAQKPFADWGISDRAVVLGDTNVVW
ncbi:MAG: hypothetical protein KAG97_12385, partial [Victivallales bacterium]|nr:hypothetical protein [Victivallales bacterium]